MKFHFKKINYLKKFKNSLKFIFIFSILIPINSYSELEIKPSVDYINRKKVNDYILGKGDQIKITIKKIKILVQSSHTIDESGFINTERLNDIYIEGLTKTELKVILEKRYSEFIKNPIVSIDIINHRPQVIYIDGEVSQPGIYSLSVKKINVENKFPNNSNNSIESEINQSSSSEISFEFLKDPKNKENTSFHIFPTLTDAIRKAGGITMNADLENIEIIRKVSLANGGGKKKANLNLLEGIEYGISSNNLTLRDGDYILLKKSNAPSLSQLSKALKSSLNPKFINVFIGGKVENPGNKVLPRYSTLLKGIYMAGGKKTLIGPIKLIRYNTDGILETSQIKFNKKSKPGDRGNPYLQNGDIIYVGKTVLNSTSEVLTEILSPFSKLLEGYVIYKALD